MNGSVLRPRSFEFGEQCVRRPGSSRGDIGVALRDLVAHGWVPQLQIVFEFVGGHDAGDGNAVFLKDEVLFIDVRPADDLPEIHARPGDGKAMDHGCLFGSFNQC